MVSKEIPKSIYFVGPWVDGFFIGFVSILLFLYCKFIHVGALYTERELAVSIACAWALNWPHIFATNYRLYQSPESRSKYSFTAFFLPLLMIAIVFACFYSPEKFAPYFIKVLFIWSPFHFSGQTIGITLLYLKRAGIQLKKWERLGVFAFAYCAFLTQTTAIETYTGVVLFSSIPYPLLGLPKWVPTFFNTGTHIIAAFLIFTAIKYKLREKKNIPWIVALPLLVQYLWFVYAADLVAFQLFISSLHGLQYLLIAWCVQMHLVAKPPEKMFRKSIEWGGINFVGGLSLFFLIPLFVSKFGWDLNFSNAIFLAVFQTHHFFVDGVIWKLRDKFVANPLMADLWPQTIKN